MMADTRNGTVEVDNHVRTAGAHRPQPHSQVEASRWLQYLPTAQPGRSPDR